MHRHHRQKCRLTGHSCSCLFSHLPATSGVGHWPHSVLLSRGRDQKVLSVEHREPVSPRPLRWEGSDQRVETSPEGDRNSGKPGALPTPCPISCPILAPAGLEHAWVVRVRGQHRSERGSDQVSQAEPGVQDWALGLVSSRSLEVSVWILGGSCDRDNPQTRSLRPTWEGG